MDLNDLQTFVSVAECGSISLAAAALDVPKSTVSRRVSRLERALGVDLLLRGAGPATLTEHGVQLYRASARALQELRDSGRLLLESAQQPSGTLRISAPFDVGSSSWFAELIAAFCREHPLVSFDIVLTGRMVNMLDETFDVTLRAHLAPLSDTSLLKVKHLGAMPMQLFASPDYLTRRGRPTEPQQLSEHDCVVLGHLPNSWSFSRGQQQVSITLRATIRHSDFASVLPLVVAGAGIAPLPTFVAAAALGNGALQRLLPQWALPTAHLSLLWPAQQRPPAKLRAFIDFAYQRGLAGLLPPAG